jgi:hypothetical protein
MYRRVCIGVLVVVAVLSLGIDLAAQQTPSRPVPPAPPHIDPYGGPPLQNPAVLAGVWEAPNGHGGIVGMQILLNTRGEDIETIEFGLFERSGAELGELPFNYFIPEGRGADSCHWDGYHLTIDFAGYSNNERATPAQRAMLPAVHADLWWDEVAATWSGVLQYKGSQGQVVLRRPAAHSTNNPFVGTWISNQRGPSDNCLHIAEESDGKLNGWVDHIPDPSGIFVPRNRPAPMPMMTSYGHMAKVQVTGNDQVALELNAYTGICCPIAFTGKISADGKSLEGSVSGGSLTSLDGPSAQPMTWSRVAGDSCAAR